MSNTSEKTVLIVVASLKRGGGAEYVAAQTGSGLYSRGHDVHYLTFYEPDEIIAFDGEYKCLKENEDEHPALKMLRLFSRAYKIKRYAEKNNIDVVIGHMEESNFAVCLSKILFGLHTNLIGVVHTNPLSRSRWYHASIRLLYPVLNCVITCSRGVAHKLSETFNLPSSDVKAIYNAVNIDKARRQADKALPKKHAKLFNSGPVFVNIGRLTKAKGQWHLIRAFQKVLGKKPKSKLLIIGEGELREKLEKSVETNKLKESVFFLGYQNNVFPFLKRASAFVSSSLWEGLQITLIESLAVGTPVISTDCEIGPREIVAPYLDHDQQVNYPYHTSQGALTAPFQKESKTSQDDILGKELSAQEAMLAEQMIDIAEDKIESDEENIKGLNRFRPGCVISEWENLLTQ